MGSDTDTRSALLVDSRKQSIDGEKVYNKFFLSKRFFIVIMLFIGEIFQASLRTNLSIAIVDMTSDISKETATNEDGSDVMKFSWDSTKKGFVLSAFSYGYAFAPIGGILASRFGGVTMFGIGIGSTALTTLLTPFLIRFNFYLFFFSRVMEGVFEGIASASFGEIWSRWAPPEERSKLTSFSALGYYFGNMACFPLAGYVAKHWGWPAIFYANGCLPLIWYVFWFILLSNDPAEDKCISKAEKEFLKKKCNRDPNEKVIYSWKKMFLSKPVWAIFINRFTIGCGQIIMIFNLPQYIKDTSDVDIKDIGYISSFPQISGVLASFFSSFVADYLRNSTSLSFTQVHKIFIGGGCLIGALTYVGIIFTDFKGSIICLCLNRFFLTCTEIVFLVSVLDMAPRHASLINGIATTFYTTSAILVPTFVGFIVTNHSVSEWNLCFVIFSFIYLIGAAFYMLYGSGETQDWDAGYKKQLITKF